MPRWGRPGTYETQRLSSKSVAGLFSGERPPRLKSLGRNHLPAVLHRGVFGSGDVITPEVEEVIDLTVG
jgi:hypothetical protein